MPLFKCSRCGCIDNTAAGGNYWLATFETKEPPTCCECHTGKWHGLFEKKTPKQLNYILHEDGFYGPVGGWK